MRPDEEICFIYAHWDKTGNKYDGVLKYRIYSNRRRPQIDAALETQNINRRRPRIDAASTVRRLFEEIMIYNNYERKVYFNFKPAMEIYFLLEQHFLVQSDCTVMFK